MLNVPARSKQLFNCGAADVLLALQFVTDRPGCRCLTPLEVAAAAAAAAVVKVKPSQQQTTLRDRPGTVFGQLSQQ